MIQTARTPDLIVHRLGAQVSALADKQAVLDFLLRAVIMRESATTGKEGPEVKGLLTAIPTGCAPAQPPPHLPRQGQANAVVSKPAERRGMLQRKFGIALFHHITSNQNNQTNDGEGSRA